MGKTAMSAVTSAEIKGLSAFLGKIADTLHNYEENYVMKPDGPGQNGSGQDNEALISGAFTKSDLDLPRRHHTFPGIASIRTRDRDKKFRRSYIIHTGDIESGGESGPSRPAPVKLPGSDEKVDATPEIIDKIRSSFRATGGMSGQVLDNPPVPGEDMPMPVIFNNSPTEDAAEAADCSD